MGWIMAAIARIKIILKKFEPKFIFDFNFHNNEVIETMLPNVRMLFLKKKNVLMPVMEINGAISPNIKPFNDPIVLSIYEV